jgi:hypothetical protein
MEFHLLDHKNYEPFRCNHCPTLPPHQAMHGMTTFGDEGRVDYLCAQAVARTLGLSQWRHQPIDLLDPAEPIDRRPRRYAAEHRLPTDHQLSELELGLVRESSAQGEVIRRASAIERLANNLHGLVTGKADPTPAIVARLIRQAIEEVILKSDPVLAGLKKINAEALAQLAEGRQRAEVAAAAAGSGARGGSGPRCNHCGRMRGAHTTADHEFVEPILQDEQCDHCGVWRSTHRLNGDHNCDHNFIQPPKAGAVCE